MPERVLSCDPSRNPFAIALIAMWAGVVLAGCEASKTVDRGESGRRAAAQVSSANASPLSVRTFDLHLRAACPPDPTRPTLADVTHRQPYLQRVGPDSAMLIWTADTAHPTGVELTSPDGQYVATAVSSVEPTAYLRDAHQHMTMIAGLEPSTVYCYRLIDRELGATSPVGFETAPLPGTGTPQSFLAIGDMGNGSDDQHAIADRVRELPFDLVLALGDNAYENGTLEEYERNFFDVYAEILSSVPVLPISGNHEYYTDDAGPFRELFSLPDNGVAGAYERWFSVDVGDVHIVGLDSEIELDEQVAWLDADLAANDRLWTIVMIHRPPYSSGHHGSFMAIREAFGEVLRRHQVPLVLSGHEHSYERTHRIDATVYVVSGGGGRETRDVGSSWFTAFSQEVLHFLWIQVRSDRLEVHAVDATGTVFDSLVLERADTPPHQTSR